MGLVQRIINLHVRAIYVAHTTGLYSGGGGGGGGGVLGGGKG